MAFRNVIVKAWVPEGEHPEHPIVLPPDQPDPPLGIWGPTDPRPTPPIVIPPDAIKPGVPTHPIYIPVYPAHPIVIPPDSIGPGVPTHPIVLPPPIPAHPIVIPPDSIAPGVPTHPIVLPPPFIPAHPIVLPPDTPPGQGQDGYPRWVYHPVYGWVLDPGPGGKPQPIPPRK